jgi:hypothetical protein
MAYQTRLSDWFATHQKDLQLRILEFSWPAVLVEPHPVDFEVSLNFGGLTVAGRGTDKDEMLALEKAGAEAIERLACHCHNIGSVGVAAHTNEESARLNARAEYIERFVFRHHLLKNEPFTFDSSVELELTGTHFECTIFRMHDCGELSSALTLITGPGVNLLGLASDVEFATAALRASIEAQRNYAAFLSAPARFYEATQTDRDLWCCDFNYIETKIRPLLDFDSRKPEQTEQPVIFYRQIPLPTDSIFADCPAVVFQAFETSAV